MLTYFSVKNFRQFRDELVFDFSKVRDYQFSMNCIKDGFVNKAIIYGKNSVGKTNLMEAMSDIFYTTRGRVFRNLDYSYRNADSLEDETIKFRYSFLLDNTPIDYYYEKLDCIHVVAEKLVIDHTTIFEYNRVAKDYNFSNVNIIGAEQLKWDDFQNMTTNEEDTEFIGSLTALRFAYTNTATVENTTFTKLIRFISRMRFVVGYSAIIRSAVRSSFEDLLNSDELNVLNFQKFLNEYGVHCKLTVRQDADGRKKMFFDHRIPLDYFSNMSSGTKLLTNFYIQLLRNVNQFSFIFIDEFDAYYHYELSEKIVQLLEDHFDCQVVLTSHNTNLLSNSIMRPDCFMILHDGKITPICDATKRELRQGHNLEKLYMSGEFDAE